MIFHSRKLSAHRRAAVLAVACLGWLACIDHSDAATMLTPTVTGEAIVLSETIPNAEFAEQPTLQGNVSFIPGAYATGLLFYQRFTQHPTTGGIIVGGEDTRSIGHFEFDASALPSTINSASLQLFLPNNGFGDDAFNSSQTIEVRSTDFDRTSSPGFYDQVHPPQFVGSDALAQVTITSANAGTTVSFDFNAAGLVYLQNAASGTDTAFNLATYLTAHTYPNRPLLMNPSVPELRYLGSVFENTGGQQAALVVNQIPEPSTLLTLLLGSAALLVRRTRKA